jgi:TRAP-type mannitol/chloroaromatic compound transport system permease small subunit
LAEKRRNPIDRLNGWVGGFVGWLTLAMVLVGAYNTIVRYLGRYFGVSLSSNAYLELQWYLFSLVFLLGGGYTLLRNAHVRVDVLYARLSKRSQAWVDLVGTLLFLIPFCLFVLWATYPAVRNSWAVWESSPDPGGLPRYPIKTVILIGFVLLILQGISEALKRIAFLRGGDGAVEDEDQPPVGAA